VEAMSVKDFDRLGRRDFENGAVLDDIREALQQRESLMSLCDEMCRNEELDGDIYGAALAGH